jgi:YidC/Oxa1 family membrane protein insertase
MAEYKSPQSEPGMDRNLLLLFVLMAVAVFGAQVLMRKFSPTPPSTAKPVQPIQAAGSAPPTIAAQPATPGTASAQKGISAQPASAKQAESESEIVIENDLYQITFTNRGAQVKKWVLKKFLDDQGKPLDLVNQAASAKYSYPLSLWTYDPALSEKLNSALYVPSASSGTTPLDLGDRHVAVPAEVTFEYADSGLTVRKTFRFDQTYTVGVETSVFSNGSPVYAFPAWPAGFGDQTNIPGYASSQFEYQVNNDVEHVPVKKISSGNTLHGTFNWNGVSDSYFAVAFIPDPAENVVAVSLRNGLDIIPDSSKPNETKPVDVVGVAVGRPGVSRERMFVGPKSLQVLESVTVPTISGAEKDLRGIVNFGWLGVIARPLFLWLRWTNQYVHNWGWSIVLQTFIITLALLPLRIHQMRSGLKMQKVAPRMKAIQEKYKKYSMKDPRKQDMQKEIGELYKEHGVNPVGGCLPLLVQMPFLIAYYKMLGATIDLRQAHWLWVHDLSSRDPFLLLPAIMVLSMFVMQKMTPQAGMDPAQQRMMNIMMPAMMGFIFYNLAAGLNLYYAESNLIMIAQQAIMNRTELGREMRELAAKRARKKDK